MRKPVTLSLEEEIWKQFKIYCINKNVDASDLIEKYMSNRVKELNKDSNASNVGGGGFQDTTHSGSFMPADADTNNSSFKPPNDERSAGKKIKR